MTLLQSSKKLNFRMIVLGIFSAVNLEIGVVLIPIELISVVYMLFSLNRVYRNEHLGLRRFVGWLMFSGIILIVSQVFIDLFMEASKLETAKSIAQIVTVVALVFTGITWIIQKELRLESFLIGYVLSSGVTFVFFRNDYIKVDSWKFLFGNVVTIMILGVLGFTRNKRFLKILVIISLTSLHLVFGSRSSALLTLLAIVSLILPSRIVAKKGGLVVLLLFIFTLSMITEQTYQELALGGKLGVSQQDKARQQYESGALLLFARSELLYEIGAIKQSPWIGKGSSPQLSQSLLFAVSRDQERFGLHVKETAAYATYLKSGTIPLHSMLFSSWVEAGLLGAFFWFVILYFFLRYFRVVIVSQNNLTILSTYFLFSALWSLFFSPLGAGSRLFIALAVTCISRLVIEESEVGKQNEFTVSGNSLKKPR